MQPGNASRLVVLDILRGFALLGMFAVHLQDRFGPRPANYTGIATLVEWFVDSKAFTTFAILFGVGFALQIRSARAQGEDYRPRLLRRLLGLALSGVIAEVLFGFHVLLSYALWGLPLFLVWSWSKRALVVALLFCAASQSLYHVSAGAWQWATLGVEGTKAANRETAIKDRAAWKALEEETSVTRYSVVMRARLNFMPWFHTRAFSFTPAGSFTCFLLGLLALWEHPESHRRLILGLMAFGVFSWCVARWVFPLPWPVLEITRVSGPIQNGFRIIREEWLVLTYIGTVLLATASWPQLLPRLDLFAAAGRMALSNYMIHIALIDVARAPYGFGWNPHSEWAPLAALALFPALALFSRWWLSKYRFGPAEWVLRSITYWKPQPMRLDTSATNPEPAS